VMQVVAVIRGDQGNAGLSRKPHEFAIHALFDLEPLILNFQKKLPLPKISRRR
jgi:hypothetical protein